ncbi:FHA domain-containing protein [Ornithinimicrobium tianjinense]|uniref:FHA domain-containing protein n=1 Tax=Ornithinimicrobium tianjinense TaxID=1195761 RepID=A0A917F2H6_9MICO|nr:FHA domain-containing protein [Ornithinimicrobium tianjinense]GGF44113.1 hypothetical protein GCM10011366_09750 [Ornithinimicrobium tianjinense]
MNPEHDPTSGSRVEPARVVGPTAEPSADVVECPNCHATVVGGVAFCGACGYDLVTGTAPRSSDTEDDEEEPRRPTALQAAEPHEAYIDPRRDADEIELPTSPAEVALDPLDLPRRPDVPPPTPPAPESESLAHEPAQTLPPSRRAPGAWVAEVWVDHVWAAHRDGGQPVPEAGPPVVVPLTADHAVIGRTNIARGLHPDLDAGTDMGVSVRHAQLTSDGEHWWVEDLDTSNGTFVSTVGLPLPEQPIDRGARVRVDEDDRVYLGGWTRLIVRRAD